MTTSYPKEKIKVLFLENIHPNADELFLQEGFQVETLKTSLSEAELIEKIREVHILGIRSKTQVTEAILKAGKKLLSVGCFCIGTNQVDLKAANRLGVPVFNAPFSNTRSVAEMVLAETIFLARQLGDRSKEVHEGVWKKVASHCHEIRGKTLGIIGYGHIGAQVGVLAEGLGLRVLFFDVAPKLSMGNVRRCNQLSELLAASDFVTLHVPETPSTKNLMSAEQLAQMKKGACLINASRGTVVDVPALASAIREGHIGGAAVDVFPSEPSGNHEKFVSELQGLPNVILTPHIGGSTEEAQAAIGVEVATSLLGFINNGTSTGAVNFPKVEAEPVPGTHRILNVHKNVPGVLRDINKIVSDLNSNIRGQMLSTDSEIGYLIMDIEQDVSAQVKEAVEKLSASIRTRILF
ncbi:MAG: phosphoglycerate dehydrogenase [Methylotenera sp.]|nr:phosphoglycerate dehydrogenase [Oligoflexia bacterium]